jgi:hypothetical protein
MHLVVSKYLTLQSVPVAKVHRPHDAHRCHLMTNIQGTFAIFHYADVKTADDSTAQVQACLISIVFNRFFTY